MSEPLAIDLSSVTIENGDTVYCVNFSVIFEVLNPRDDIYKPNGSEEVDTGQDEVNFILVTIDSALRKDGKEWVGCSADYPILCELALDWCRDNSEMHIEAFKAFKGYK